MIDIGADLQRAYDEGFKEGQETERPRAFGAGYKAGFDNASKRPKGEWQSYRVENPDMVDGYVGGYACSECGEPSVVDSPFCAWCGAEMGG